MAEQLTIALVACEESGDYLGGELIKELKKTIPQANFCGIGGKRMQQQGLRSYFPLEKLTTLGITEALIKLPQLWRARRQIKSLILRDKADIFIGIDAPDFNLGLEEQLRQHSIKTVHYVSPTIWAWRANRIKKIKRAADLVLCLYPFETKYYHKENIAAIYIGHPLADTIKLHNDKQEARRQLSRRNNSVKLKGEYIALLPGSRTNELNYLTDIFIQTALECLKQKPKLQFLIAVTNDKHRSYIESRLPISDNFHFIVSDSHKAMAAADAVLLASGTASLECLLLKRPMVVAYKTSALTHWLLSRMIKIDYISQPNWLSGAPLVEEYIQQDANAKLLAPALLKILADQPAHLKKEYKKIHLQLRKNAAWQAAQAINNLSIH